jgi:Regulator of ribonuclease activity B
VRTLTLELVRRTRRSLEALAAEHGGVYDGWEARAS